MIKSKQYYLPNDDLMDVLTTRSEKIEYLEQLERRNHTSSSKARFKPRTQTAKLL